MPFLVIAVQPRYLIEPDPFNYIFRTSLTSHRSNRLSIFDTALQAETYILKQQIMLAVQQSFLLMSFEMILINALLQQQRSDFFNSLTSMSYYAPAAAPRPVRFTRNESLDRQDVEFFRSEVRRQDTDFSAAQTASMQQEQPRATTPAVTSFAQVRNDVPADFKLAEETKKGLANKTQSCPITLTEFEEEDEEIACVKTDNGYYQLYNKDALTDHYNRNKLSADTFKDPLTNNTVNVNDVFSIKLNKLIECLHNLAQPAQESRPAPRR